MFLKRSESAEKKVLRLKNDDKMRPETDSQKAKVGYRRIFTTFAIKFF